MQKIISYGFFIAKNFREEVKKTLNGIKLPKILKKI